MMNFGWAELMVIGVVALIVIGPDDLPGMFRQLGRFTAKLRQMSREFSRAMEQAAKESGVKDVAADLRATTSAKALGLDAVKAAADKFEKWDPMKNAAKPMSAAGMAPKPLIPPPMPATLKPATPKPVVVDDALEEAEDLAEHDAAAARGPATQALYDKRALKAQVLAEQTAKLTAIEAGSYQAGSAIQAEPVILPPAKPARAVRARVATKGAGTAVADAAVKAAPKPRKTVRKAEEA